MAGQLWSQASGYMATPTLSKVLRQEVQPITRFTQFCDVEEAIGTNNGEKYVWNIYGNLKQAGNENGIPENQKMPETSGPVHQGEAVITEFGNSVPFSSKYDALSEHPVRQIINQQLKEDAASTTDRAAHREFNKTLLRATSTSASGLTIVDTGATTTSHTDELSFDHVKELADEMQERNIPTYDGQNYCGIMRPRTMRPLKNELEEINKYTSQGWMRIIDGEVGRVEGIRLISQTNIASSGWDVSDAAYFFGADTVTEVISIPMEIRGKIPDDYGRSKGIAWYGLGQYAISHADKTDASTKKQARIIKWDSAS